MLTLTQTPGTYFQQTTTGGGTANLSPPTTAAPYTQDHDALCGHDPYRGGPLHNLALNGTITSTISNPEPFPPPAGAHRGQHPGGGGPGRHGPERQHDHDHASRPGDSGVHFTSPVSIDTTTSVLTASNLVGRNVANPGVNRVPARQTGAATAAPLQQ